MSVSKQPSIFATPLQRTIQKWPSHILNTCSIQGVGITKVNTFEPRIKVKVKWVELFFVMVAALYFVFSETKVDM